ncbi:MAG: trigger factor, partial [Anaerolineae bacterium]
MFEVSKEILDSHEALLEIVFEDEVVEEAKRQAAREIAREVEIPGFRKGRAPYAKVSQVVGEPAILQEAAEHLLNEHYAEFLEEADVSPYGAGEFVDMDTSPLTFRIKVPLEPTVDLGDYRDLREEWVPPTVSEEEVDQVLEQVREEHAVLEPVDRPAELGDEILVDVQATVDGDVIVDEEDIEAVLSEERPFLSVEFVQALIGISVDEERTFTATLPETIEEPSLRGVEAEFTVKTKQIYERRLPELDDALASTVGSFETLEELVEDIRERILSSKREQAETAYRSQLVDKLVEEAEIAYPPQIIEDTLDDMIEEARNRLRRQQGQMSLEDALRLEGRTVEQLREEMRPQAERRVARSLVLHEFAEQEDIEVSDDEVVQEYSDLLDQMGLGGRMPEAEVDVDSKLGRDLQSNVLGRKVMSRLARLGRGELE